MNDPVDVLIIGAGASGAAVAWSLADTKMHILCLDQGGWMNPSEYPSTGRDWEAKFYGDWSSSPNIRGRPEDYPVNDDNSPIKVVNFNGVGGSTVMYTAHWPRLHPSDFKVKTLDGVADDWPIDYDALTPFFEENDRMMGVSGLSGDPLSPLTHPPMPPQPLGLSGPLIGKAMNKLGWHWWPSDTTVATMDYEGRARCINLGHCTPACAQGAKASTDITYWPHAIRAGVELKTHCRVREILTNEHGMASGVVYYDKDGVEQFQPAEVVIIACNGVGTPRLLLNSVSGRFPNGLANSSGLVGKNLMFHPYAQIYGYVKEPTDSNRAPPTCLWGKEFYDTDLSRGFVRGYGIQFVRGAGPVFEAVVSEQKGILPWGADHHRVFRKLNGHRLGVSAICEDLPEEHNRVTLDPVLKDSHGIPAPRIDYTISENSRKMMEHGLARGREILEVAGATDICTNSPIPWGGWHLLGTARMGADPARSVVNEWGRSHDVKNLFIVDGSVFVTSGGVNPTSTIQAIALYVADQMKQLPTSSTETAMSAANELTTAQRDDLRTVAAMIVPASDEYEVPGADDPAIQADMLATLGRDTALVTQALDYLARLAGQPLAELDTAKREAIANEFRATGGAAAATLVRVVLQCYYRDDRVLRSLGLELRAPFPKGYALEQGDWSLLDPVKARPATLRRAP